MTNPRHFHDPTGVRAFRSRILAFFDECRRDLPWRRTSDPYRILVSEIMLQQTRVETVVPYYRSWVQRFPDPASLAEADEEEVLRHWQGLGYYRRARNLQAAAREVVGRWGGQLPEEAEALATLPGVGPYTAGAVASIAFGEAVPAIDGNVRRVMARLLDHPAPGAALLARQVGALVDPGRPGDFNQAMMELGATVCTPRSPACHACPVTDLCRACAAGTQGRRPLPPRKREIPHRVEAVAVVVQPGPEGWEVLLRRRPEGGLLGGMWECPGVDVGPHGEEADLVAAALQVARGAMAEPPAVDEGGTAAPSEPGPRPVPLRLDCLLPEVDHLFSHRRVTYRPVRFRAEAPLSVAPSFRWVAFGALDPLPLPRAQERILGDAEPEDGV
jgi:A/G-specific adenine glycosylase